MRDSDRAEAMRALASFYLVAGRPRDAVRIAEQALRAPDRRGHNSRDPAQDRAIVALLHRHAVRYLARVVAADAAGGSVLERIGAYVEVLRLSVEAWESGRRILQLLSDRTRLVGLLRIGLSTGGVTPSFLVEDLVDIMGAGAFRAAVAEARTGDRRPASRAYYDAMEAEARVASGDHAGGERLALRALDGLPQEEGLLRARVLVRLSQARMRASASAAVEPLARAYALDPTVLRRLRIELPVRLSVEGSGAAEVRDGLSRVAELDVDSSATASLRVSVRGRATTACLAISAEPRCAEVAPLRGESARAFRKRLPGAVLDAVLGPMLALEPTQIAELEGPMREARQRLQLPFP